MTYEELMAKARELAASGNIEAAKRATTMAQAMRDDGSIEPAKPSTWQTIKENIVGDDDPTTQNFGEKVGTWLNKAGEAMTFGLIGDEASAAAAAAIPGGMGYDERLAYERGQEALLEKTNPVASIGAELGGSLLGAFIPGAAIGTAAKGARLLPRIAQSAAAGAGMGGTYGFMEGEGAQDRLGDARTGATIGGIVGAAVPAIGAGVQKVAESRAINRAIREGGRNAPTTEALRATGRGLYNQVDDAGVSINANAVRSQMADIADAIRGEGLKYSSVAPQMPASTAALGVAAELAGTPQNSIPFSDLDVARRAIGAAAGSNLANRADTRVATQALSSLDDFVANLGPNQVDAGDISALQSALPKAREIWGRMSRSQLIDDAMENAQNYVSGGASGLRNQFKRIVNNDRLRRGFSDLEIAAMRRVAQGSIPEQLIQYLGSGLGSMAQMAVGGLTGGIPGALAGAGAAAGTRAAAQRLASRNAEIARALVANGAQAGLPVVSDTSRRITEGLLRRIGAVGPQ